MTERTGDLYRWVGDKSGSVWGEMEHALLIGRLVPVEPLFRRATAAEESTNDHDVYGPFVQVWPEDALPTADDVYGILNDDS